MYDGDAFDLVGPIFQTVDGKAGSCRIPLTDNLAATGSPYTTKAQDLQ